MNHRNIALGLAIAAYFLSFFHRVAPAAIAHELSNAFQISAASLGTLAATYFIIYTLTQVPTGILADTLGPRRILFIGGLVAGGGSLLFGLAPNFTLAFVGRTLVGLGVSVTFIAMLKLVAVWFEERRFATLTGLCMLIGNAGAIAAGAPLAWMTHLTSWRHIFVGVGILSLIIAIASLFLVRDGPVQSKQASPQGTHSRRGVWHADLRLVLGNRATWPGFFVNLGMAASFFSFAGLWAVPYFTQALGMTHETASNHVSLYFLGYAIGAMLLGSLSDRLGRRKPLLVTGSLLHALGWLVWLSGIPLSSTASYALCTAMGLATASFTLTWACAKEVNPPLLSGMATSVVNVGVFLGPAILMPLTGWVMDQSWQASQGALLNGVRLYSASDFHDGLLLMCSAAVAGCIATWWVRETGCRNIWKNA